MGRNDSRDRSRDWRDTPKARREPDAPAAPPGVKETVMLRIDRDVLEIFQQDGPGWQDRVNAALRKAAGK